MNRLEHEINQIQGAVGSVFLEKELLTVHCGRTIPEERIQKAVAKAGYEISSLKYISIREE